MMPVDLVAKLGLGGVHQPGEQAQPQTYTVDRASLLPPMGEQQNNQTLHALPFAALGLRLGC